MDLADDLSVMDRSVLRVSLVSNEPGPAATANVIGEEVCCSPLCVLHVDVVYYGCSKDQRP